MLCCAAFACIAIAAAACDKGDGTTATPTPSVASGSPLPTSTPTPPPADPTLAERLRYEGDFGAAADVYGQIAAAAPGEERLEALLSQAQMLLRADRAPEARPVLEAYVASAGASAEGSQGQYLLASTLDDLGEPQAALDVYSRYVLAGGVLASYANIERAKLLAGLGRGVEAEAVATGVLADPSVAELRGSFALSMAGAYATAGLSTDALAWFARVEANGGDAAAALRGQGAIKQALGDATWVGDELRAIALAPGSGGESLASLDAAAVPVSDYLRGLVSYRAFENDAARVALQAAVAVGDNAAGASYYLGALDERADNDAAAILHYQQSYDFDPASPLADDALWWRGRLLENAGRYDEATVVYALLAADYPGSDWTEGAAFRRGLVTYKAGDYTEAATAWNALAAEDGVAGFRAWFWQWRALRSAGDETADSVLEDLVADPEARGDYYALRAEVLLGDNIEKEKKPDFKEKDPDWDAILDALTPAVTTTAAAAAATTAAATPEPTETPVDLAADLRWEIAGALEAVALHGLADDLRLGIIEDAAQGAGRNPDEMLAVTRRFYDDGKVSFAARSAARLAALTPEGQLPSDDLLRLAYPPAFSDLVTDAAKEEDVDALLLMALMRQESLYDPDAGSTAGAVGLTQIIPPTGESIAVELGVSTFTAADLFRPRTSLRFGAHFLAGQIEAFDGNVYHALAAYNGGPGAANDALGLAGSDDVDLFVEDLEFDETNLYVRLVMEHYAQYRHLYGGVERPSLPE
ncbi:MAG: transglycosylase SLT domain-containing protein [Chloroflexi bacterium]|nr:transglycosylase SLT domain-containing protein [Chloroflexota bacterium]